MKVLGILNITEDSFSDGGKYLEPMDSIRHAEMLVNDGADIIDIGAQSSNILSKSVSSEIEWLRILPVIEFLKEKKTPVSVDTYKPEVIQKCLEYEVDFINDITALENPISLEIIQSYKEVLPNLILMYSHNHSERAEKKTYLKPETIWDHIFSFFENKRKELVKLGIPEDKIIYDPGMGFFLGEDPELSFTVLRKIASFKKEFGQVLVSVSRKSFLGAVLGGIAPLERGSASLIAEFYAYTQGVDYIRTHNPLSLIQAIRVWNHIVT